MMMKELKESQKNRQDFTRQILARLDAIASNVPKLNETDALFAEYSSIIDAEKQLSAEHSRIIDTEKTD
jgi:hypothetical protein